jgi:AbrB family looped-hinge helix DNA binding protein
MELVTVKTKFQIVIPQRIREMARVGIGDLLEVGIENGRITFTPKSLVDRHIAEGLVDLAAGRSHGPYSTAADAIAAVERRARKKSRTPRSAARKQDSQK